LLPFVTGSWYVAVEKVKQKMLAANAQTHWVPGNIRDGRFGKWLENARDWAISRNRYWGTPLPIWRDNASGKVEVIGSRDELMAKVPGRFSKIIVARHAESRGNVEKIYQGNLPGTDLTPTGLKQAKELGKEIAASIKRGAPATVVYCSPLNRTRQTAQAVADALGLEVKVDERLRELNFGDYEGKHIDFDDLTFVRERRAHKLATDQVESVFHFPGMETWESSERPEWRRFPRPRQRREPAPFRPGASGQGGAARNRP
jgi:phosphohistidine phosphatase SixA